MEDHLEAKAKKIPQKQDSLHAGHRERVKKKFLAKGLDDMEPHVILELLLYYAISRKDTNPLAHALLNQFGSLSAVLDAPLEELVKIPGVTPSAATLLKLIPQLSRVYLEGIQGYPARLYDTKTTGEFLMRKFIGRKNEVVVLLLTDSKGRILYCDVVNEGTVHMVPIYVRKIIGLAVQYNAAGAVIAHNHPSGDIMPSSGDVTATRELYQALKAIHMDLEDHFIITEDAYISMADSGLLDKILGNS